MNEMYNRIERLCKTKGINVTQMCKEANVARAPLTELKKGRTANLSAINAEKIASYFGVSVGYLLGTDQKEKPVPSEEDELSELQTKVLQKVKNASDAKLRAIIELLGDE